MKKLQSGEIPEHVMNYAIGELKKFAAASSSLLHRTDI